MATALRRTILILFALWCVFPVYWILATSLKKPVDAIAYPPKWFFTPTLENYLEVLTTSEVIGYFRNSIIIGLGTTLLGLLCGVPTAYILSRFEFRGRGDYDFWILSTRMAPPVATLIPYFVAYRSLGLQDTHLGLIIVHVSLNLAIIIWVMKSFFNDLPEALEEAALIDGCSYWQMFSRIVLPLTLPGIVATGILTFLFSWNEFLFALVLTNKHARTVPVGLHSFIGYQDIKWAELSASAIVMLVPVFILVLVFQRQLIRGLTFGAVRG